MTCCHLLETPTDIQTDEYICGPVNPHHSRESRVGTGSEVGFGDNSAENMKCPPQLNKMSFDCRKTNSVSEKLHMYVFFIYFFLLIFFPTFILPLVLAASPILE